MGPGWDYTRDAKEPVVHIEKIASTNSSEVHKVCVSFQPLTLIDEEFDDVEGIDSESYKSNRCVQVFARKLILPHSDALIENEVRAITKLCLNEKPNIISVFRHFSLTNSAYYAIDMEYCKYNLADYIKTPQNPVWAALDEPATNLEQNETWRMWSRVAVVMLHICSGMDFIHEHGEVHRDLKPENSLFPLETKLMAKFYFHLADIRAGKFRILAIPQRDLPRGILEAPAPGELRAIVLRSYFERTTQLILEKSTYGQWVAYFSRPPRDRKHLPEISIHEIIHA
jgi:hypothetical protein